MKKSLLTMIFLALLAAPSFAYVQSGQILGGQSPRGSATTEQSHKTRQWMDAGTSIGNPSANPVPEPIYEPLGEPPARPIPEPGTMVLASLGLLALGVSRARRRGH